MAKVKANGTTNRVEEEMSHEETVFVRPPNLKLIPIKIRGDAPYVQHNFGAKARAKMRGDMEAGTRSKGKVKREPRDFEAEYREATYTSGGEYGIPAAAFRAAMISACRVAGLVMKRAKLSVFVMADRMTDDGKTPLVLITKGKPFPFEAVVRFQGKTSLCVRPMWAAGWEATVYIRYDADQFDASSVVNLLARAGLQVGVGEGRPDSKESCGQGWGTFEVVTE